MNAALKFHDVEQNTDEWMAMRAGRFTSSNSGKVMANFPKAFGEPAKKYAIQLAVQQITGNNTSGGFTNEHTERGHEQEPLARMLYEEETFCDVAKGGFFCNEFIGCSPDGLVYDDGVIEIKSVLSNIHYANVKRQGVDPAYRWQCIGNLKFTGRKWLDFVSYCSDFPEGKKLYTCRIYADSLEKQFSMLDTRIDDFKFLVEETKSKILNASYSVL
jgi:hypothetical protein